MHLASHLKKKIFADPELIFKGLYAISEVNNPKKPAYCLRTATYYFNFLYAQENSPYSRYGLGDIAPSTNIVNRGMEGLSAAYADPFSINFTNPASYSQFLSYIEEKSKKTASGRVLFDVGINYTSHTLREGNSAEKI